MRFHWERIAELDNIANKVTKTRKSYLVISSVALVFLGFIYAFSMLVEPMCEAFDFRRDEVGLTFNIMMIAFCLGNICASWLLPRRGFRFVVSISAFLFLLGFCGTGVLISQTIWALYILYGAVAGLGVGMAYNALISVTNAWFPDKIGFSSGVLMMGFGLGSLILGNLAVELGKGLGIAAALNVVGIVGFVFVALAALLLHEPADDIVGFLLPSCGGAANEPSSAGERSMVLSPSFYLYFPWSVIGLAIGLATIGNCSQDAQLSGAEPWFASLLVGLVSICNGLSRIVIGLLLDKKGIVTTMTANSFIAILATICIVVALATGIPFLYVVGALLCGFCYGGVPVANSAFARRCFGQRQYPFNLAVMAVPIMIASLLNIFVQHAVGGEASRIAVFVVMLVLAVAALLEIVPFSKRLNRIMGKQKSAL